MTIVERVFKETDLPESSRAFARDTVTLGWEDRTYVHGRRRTDGGVEFGTSLPRGSVLRSFVLNHSVHHRAQLGVYLRMLDVPVPAMYGPTADTK